MDDNTKDVMMLAIQTAGVFLGGWLVWQQMLTRQKLNKVSEDVNGPSEMLIAAVKGEARATGKAEGVAQERQEQRDRESNGEIK